MRPNEHLLSMIERERKWHQHKTESSLHMIFQLVPSFFSRLHWKIDFSSRLFISASKIFLTQYSLSRRVVRTEKKNFHIFFSKHFFSTISRETLSLVFSYLIFCEIKLSEAHQSCKRSYEKWTGCIVKPTSAESSDGNAILSEPKRREKQKIFLRYGPGESVY